MKKLTYLPLAFMLIILFPIMESCKDEGCSSSTEYYDYSALEFEEAEANHHDDDYYYFVISAIMDYEVQSSKVFFGSSLMAESLTFLPIHEIEEIKILTDKPFVSTDVNAHDISKHIEVYNNQEWSSLSNAEFGESNHLYLRCMIWPDTDQLFDFTINITKSNGEVVTSTFSNLKIE